MIYIFIILAYVVLIMHDDQKNLKLVLAVFWTSTRAKLVSYAIWRFNPAMTEFFFCQFLLYNIA